MPPVGFELTIPVGKWPQTYALDRAATGTGCLVLFAVHYSLIILAFDAVLWDTDLVQYAAALFALERKRKLYLRTIRWASHRPFSFPRRAINLHQHISSPHRTFQSTHITQNPTTPTSFFLAQLCTLPCISIKDSDEAMCPEAGSVGAWNKDHIW